jgi:hypothetical protein
VCVASLAVTLASDAIRKVELPRVGNLTVHDDEDDPVRETLDLRG